jgi:very-short-patch-repair endonuclease
LNYINTIMSHKLTKTQFISKARTIHGELYDYSLSEYISRKLNLKIICPVHGIFEQAPDNHLAGQGCFKCGKNKRTKQNTHLIEDVIIKANIIHNNLYDYSDFKYVNSRVKGEIICNTCGNRFMQSMSIHTNRKCGCPACKFSKGERIISAWLKKHNLIFEEQYKFSDCRHKLPLPFDFYLPELNCCIEFDGEQHFQLMRYIKDKTKQLEAFQTIIFRDAIKTTYCEENNITLLRIPYYEFKNISKMLHQHFFNNLNFNLTTASEPE